MPKRKNPAAVALAKRRMSKMTPEERQAVAQAGGTARSKALSAAAKKAIARKAAAARWKKESK